MIRFLYTTLFLFACACSYGQQSIEFTQPIESGISITEKTIFYDLDGTIVPIKIRQYGEKYCTEDGSFSVYCGKKNIRYVNCETEHGKTEQHFEMIEALMVALRSG